MHLQKLHLKRKGISESTKVLSLACFHTALQVIVADRGGRRQRLAVECRMIRHNATCPWVSVLYSGEIALFNASETM